MKIIDKIVSRLKNTKLLGPYIKRISCPRYWYSGYYKTEPIEEKTILYLAYRNNIMGGNPYAIFRELISRPEYSDYKHVWIYGDPKNLKDDTFERYKSLPNVVCVRARTREYCRYLAAANYIVCNSSIPSWCKKREGQVYINTWHGVPLKTLGRCANDRSKESVSNSQRNFFFCDYMVMPNRYTIDHMMEAYDIKGMMTGSIIDAGYPRTDLVRNTSTEYIKGLLELKLDCSLENKKLVLYAPTFRTKNGKSVNTSAEVGRYMHSLMNILPEGYELIFKVHNMMAKFFKKDKKMRSRLIFDEIETNELLSVTDILITDYSSIFFDFLCTKRPILFFDYDKEEYSNGRGLYLPLEELPGAVCETIEEMEENFRLIDEGVYDYSANYARFLKEFAYNDDGEAARRVVDIIFGQKPGLERYIYRGEDAGERILVVGKPSNSLSNKGECILALERLEPEKNTVSIMAPYVYSYGEHMDEKLKNIGLIGFEPIFLFTLREKIRQKLFHRMPKEEEFYKRQYENYFGDLKFSRIIDLNGENSPWRPVLEKYSGGEYEPRTEELTPEERVARREAVGRRMSVLFLATFDSVNYVYVNLIRELEKRGYDVTLIVRSAEDEVNFRMFVENDIPFIPADEYDLRDLSKVDIVICSPFGSVKFNRIMTAINRKRIFCIGFISLFSSILMRPYTDIVFSVGRSKFEEFEENYLHYSVVAVGNPQYDGLVDNFNKPRIEPSQIKRVLFIDQGGYPFGTEGKKLLGRVILAMAEKHPDMSFTVKPRFLPDDIKDGVILHRPSEHLYDFIPDPPKNLTLLREATILEDIITEYDAVATMWSTAYLDAAMRNMPVMLISELPSEEVLDVRVQRIEEAYAHLEKTGCVIDYNDVLAGKLEFNYVNSEYLANEVENAGTVCAPEIVNILEDIHKHWIVSGLRPCEVFQTDGASFREKLPEMATFKAGSVDYGRRRSFMIWFNNRMQDLAFLNRSMAKPFDFSPLMKYWDFFPPKNFKKRRRKRLELKVRITTELIKRKYFNSSQIKSETDGIRLDYYFDRLFKRKKYRTIKKFSNPNVLPETRAFYLSMIYLREGKYAEAAKEFAAYYHIMTELNVKPVNKDRKLSIGLIPNGAESSEFFKQLFDLKEYELLKELAASKRFGVALRKRYLKLILRAEKLTQPKSFHGK